MAWEDKNDKVKHISKNVEEKLTNFIVEEVFENKIEKELNDLGWESIANADLKRTTETEVILWDVLKEQIMVINEISEYIADKIIKQIEKEILLENDLIKQNEKAIEFLKFGVKVANEKIHRTINYKIIDLDNIDINKFLVVRQLEVYNSSKQLRLPDITLYINGLPLVVCEIKKPLAEENVESAYKQNLTLSKHNPSLFAFNVFSFLSDNINTKYGNIFAPLKYYAGWQKWFLEEDKKNLTPASFLFDKNNFLNIIKRYVFWSNGSKQTKYIAHPHQIIAVEKEIKRIKEGKMAGRGGVIWHTQGSGKSVTMVFLAYAIQQEIVNSTVIMLTDRNTLDNQLIQRFNEATNYLQTSPIHIKSRKELSTNLKERKGNGIFFTTIQKLEEETGVLSTRENIYIVCDEAHRSQNSIEDGFKIDDNTIKNKKGFAAFLREAFPNATYIGFTGTPLLGQLKVQTTDIFGDYTDKYLLKQAQEDGTVLKILYENASTDITLPDTLKTEINKLQKEFRESIKDQAEEIRAKKEFDLDKALKSSLILENENVIKIKAEHMMNHYFSRAEVLHGKAMIVASSRLAAYYYYKNIIKLHPEMKEKIILVLSQDNKQLDDEISKAMVPSAKMHEVEEEFKKDNSIYKIVIVCAMWLTGYDCPDLDCLYLDKILKWHNLMQTIARVNRVYEDATAGKIKEYGLIVDYNNIWKPLLEALVQYGDVDAKDEFTLEEVNLAKTKLFDTLSIINENFIKNVMNLKLDDKTQIYSFIIQNAEIVSELENEQKTKILNLIKTLNRYMKICFNLIDRSVKEIISIVNLTKQVAIQREIYTDENLDISKKKLIELIEAAFKDPSTSISVIAKTFKKDITTVTDILKETNELEKISTKASVEFIKNWLKKEIESIINTRPWVSRELSKKLDKILEKMKEHEDIDTILELLKDLAKEYNEEIKKPTEFKDSQLQAFFEIIKSDNYFTKKYNENSEELRNIAIDINNAIKGKVTDQFLVNSKVKSSVIVELRSLLKKKYNYPPEKLIDSSKRFIESITEEIKTKPIKVSNQE